MKSFSLLRESIVTLMEGRMAVKGQVSEMWKQTLRDQGINDFETLVSGDVGAEPFKKKVAGNVQVIKIVKAAIGASRQEIYYLKRYQAPSVFSQIKGILRFRWPRTGARNEYEMAAMVREQGFDAMEPVAWAESKFLWIFVKAGALLAAEVPGVALSDVFNDPWYRTARRSILFRLGVLYARLHTSGLPVTPRMTDLICRSPEALHRGDLHVALIDLETKGRRPQLEQFRLESCNERLARALYRFLRARYRFEGASEVRAALRGYRSVLRNASYDPQVIRLHKIVSQTDSLLARHIVDQKLSCLIPNMPKSVADVWGDWARALK